MKDLVGQMILPFLGCWLLGAVPTTSDVPTPELEKSFSMILSDGTKSTAVFLPAENGNLYLVYATQRGNLGFWTLTKGTGPIPPDPDPPPPPEPTRLTIVVIENPERSTQIERDILADDQWRGLAMEKHNFLGILPVDLVDKRTGKPPTLLAPFLNLAKGKELPWMILGDDAGKVIWNGHLPESKEAVTNLIKQYGG
ncbi:hypothetical protein LCGC14_3039520 [marine sediment metagenome]|uniref:Uncharacterized protein n=1 Tax=marine sediment metagenome TaxID=412755 RepID=A0A0F8XDC0_9ZZZZ